MPITAACAIDSPAGLGTALRAGTTTVSANVPWYFSVSRVALRVEGLVAGDAGSPITECSTTSVPSSSRPAPSQPRIIGNWSGLMPTPRSVHRSCMLRLAAATSTATQPSGTSGSGRSPTVSDFSGSSGFGSEA